MKTLALLALIPTLAFANSLYDNTPILYSDPVQIQPSTWNGADLNALQVTTTTTTVGGSPSGGTDTALTAWTGIAFASTSTTLGQVSIRLKKGAGVADGGTISAYLFTNNGDASNPIHTLRFITGSGSTPSKMCYCSFTPTGSVYAWVSLTKNNAGTGIGTTTTCP